MVASGGDVAVAVGGAWSTPGEGPFPAGSLIPALKPRYDDNWVVGFAVDSRWSGAARGCCTTGVLYGGLTAVSAEREPARRAARAAG